MRRPCGHRHHRFLQFSVASRRRRHLCGLRRLWKLFNAQRAWRRAALRAGSGSKGGTSAGLAGVGGRGQRVVQPIARQRVHRRRHPGGFYLGVHPHQHRAAGLGLGLPTRRRQHEHRRHLAEHGIHGSQRFRLGGRIAKLHVTASRNRPCAGPETPV